MQIDRGVQVIMNLFYECVNGRMDNNQVSQIKRWWLKNKGKFEPLKNGQKGWVWKIDHLPHESFEI